MIMKEKYTKPLRRLLKEGGIWINFSNEKYGIYKTAFQIFRFIFCLGVWILQISVSFQEGIQVIFKPHTLFIPLGAVLFTAVFIILLLSNNLEKLVDRCEVSLSSYKSRWEIDIVEADCKKMDGYANFGKNIFYIFTYIYISIPLIFDTIRAAMGYRNPYYLPLPLEGYLDPDGSRSAFYYLIVFTSDLWFLFAIALCNAFEGLIIFIVSYNLTEFKIIKASINNLYSMEEKKYDDGISLLKPWKLKKIIKYHSKLIRLNKLQNEWITSPYIVQNVLCTVNFAYLLFMVRQLAGDNTLMMFLVAFELMIVGLLFTVCYAGELIRAESDELFETIYNSPWYRQSPKTRKDILLILMMSTKPLGLHYKQNVIHLPVFMELMNTSYSFFMLITSLEQE